MAYTYEPYKDYELYDIINEPRRISKDPYKLHAAFLISCLFEACPDDDGNTPSPNSTWGWTIPSDILESILKNANEQFAEACDNDLQIDVWNALFTVRHSKDIDRNRLNDIFGFQKQDGGYIVTKNGIMNLAQPLEEALSPIGQVRANKEYLHKVVVVAEDDENDGWYRLTDMEITMYLWYLYKSKTKDNNYPQFRKKFKKYLTTNERSEFGCWNHRSQTDGKPTGLYLFSADKVRQWNKDHRQKSIIA